MGGRGQPTPWHWAVLLVLAAAGLAGCGDQPPAPTEPAAPPVQPAPAAPPAPSAPAAGTPRAVVELYADTTIADTAAWVQLQVAAWQKVAGENLTVKIFNPDDKTNYTRLTALEAAAGLKQFDAVEAFVYPVAVADEPARLPAPAGLRSIALVGRAAIEKSTAAAVAAILHPAKGLLSAARPEILRAAAARLIAAHAPQYALPDAFPGRMDPQARGVVARWQLQFTGIAHEVPIPVELALLYQPIDCPVCADTELLAIVVGNQIAGVEPLRPIERAGTPIPEEAQKFLAQFARQTLDGKLEQRLTQVDGIAGATKTATNVKSLLGALDRSTQPSQR